MTNIFKVLIKSGTKSLKILWKGAEREKPEERWSVLGCKDGSSGIEDHTLAFTPTFM